MQLETEEYMNIERVNSVRERAGKEKRCGQCCLTCPYYEQCKEEQ